MNIIKNLRTSGLTLLFAVTILLSSCITQKKCEDRFPSKDSVSTSVIYKDSLVFIGDTLYFAGDSVVIHDSIKCPDYYKETKVGRITSTVSIKNGKLKVVCHEDSLQHILDSVITIRTKTASEFKSEKSKPVEVFKTTKFDLFCRWGFAISLLVIVILMAGKIVKNDILKVFQK